MELVMLNEVKHPGCEWVPLGEYDRCVSSGGQILRLRLRMTGRRYSRFVLDLFQMFIAEGA